MKPFVILDRDGVINEDSDAYIKSPEEWRPIPGSCEAIAKLTQAGFDCVVATNQSGIAREYFTLTTLTDIHIKMVEAVRTAGGDIAGIYFCPHGPNEGCDCRKPKAGLFHNIAHDFNVDLNICWAVGDSARDIIAAQSVGAKPIWVKTGKGEKAIAAEPTLAESVLVVDDLQAAVAHILKEAQQDD